MKSKVIGVLFTDASRSACMLRLLLVLAYILLLRVIFHG